MTHLVELKKIGKTFPGVRALNNVSFTLDEGEVHVIVGENGAGKSTLIKVLSGVYHPEEGEIIIEGKKHAFKLPIEAINAGIMTIYQEFNLAEDLSVAENIFMGRLPMRWKKAGIVNWKKLYEDAIEVLQKMKVDLNPKELVKNIGVAQKQAIEIAKAISIDPKVLILDEPTAALSSNEINELFKIIDALKNHGVGIIYISHRLQEVKRIGDKVTILRDGEYIDTLPIKDTDIDTIIRLMVNKELKEKFPQRKVSIGEKFFEVKNLSTRDKLKNINFFIKRGEIVGVAGLVGSGRTELARALFGVDRRTSGDIFLNGKKIKINKPLDAIKSRMAYLAEERKKDGLVLILSVKENIVMASSDQFTRGLFIKPKKEKVVAQSFVDKLSIKTPDLSRMTLYLSGGNQQKVVIAKWLCAHSDIFIFDEPTRGIDVGAKIEVYNLMNELAERGACIIMISSELPEIIGMSDRVIIMYNGAIVATYSKEEATQESILNVATGGK